MRDQKDFTFHVFKALCKIHFQAWRQEISFKTTVNAYLFFRENILLHKLSTGLSKSRFCILVISEVGSHAPFLIDRNCNLKYLKIWLSDIWRTSL